jgi:hypothetical protein
MSISIDPQAPRLVLEALGIELPLAEVYEGLPLSAPVPRRPPS